MKKFFILLSIIPIFFFCTTVEAEVLTQRNKNIVKAQVVKIEDMTEGNIEMQETSVLIKEGPFKGKHITFTRTITKYSKNDFKLYKDSDIYINLYIQDDTIMDASLAYVSRQESITLLAMCFLGVLVLFGMRKGVQSAISLILSGYLIIKVLIPWIKNGQEPVYSTVIVASLIITISFIMISGFSKKSIIAIIGTILGTFLAGVLASYFSNISFITGIENEYSQFLILELGVQIDFRGLLFSGIILGTLGAVMDVSMSIASVLDEIKTQQEKASLIELFTSGLRVGRDIMATMVNTLILAYAGTALPLFLFLSFMNMETINIINSEAIAVEIIRALCGSIGLIMSVPFTSLVGAIILTFDNEKNKGYKYHRNIYRKRRYKV